MGKPSPPKPPNPKDTSAAQTGTNVSTSIANNMMGLINQKGPTGSLTYFANTDKGLVPLSDFRGSHTQPNAPMTPGVGGGGMAGGNSTIRGQSTEDLIADMLLNNGVGGPKQKGKY